MTVAADNTKDIYAGNDIATVFPYNFKLFKSTDLVAIHTDASDIETTLTVGVDYSVSGVGDANGSVTYPLSGDPLATGEKITLWRVPGILQNTDFQNQGGFFANSHENALDLLTMVCQYVSEFAERSFALQVSDQSGARTDIPGPVAGHVIGWNQAEDALENLDPGSVALALPAGDSIIASMINAAGTQATLTKLLSGNTAVWQKGADVASAAALPVLSDGNYVDVTGTDAITSIDTVGIGTIMILQFDGILTFTHHVTDLVLPTGANITTAAGDHAIMVEYAADDWRCVGYFKANGQQVSGTFSGICSGILSGVLTGTIDLGSDADGDVYYRNAGILKRLPKGSDGDQLELASGIPSWKTPVGQTVKAWVNFDGSDGTINASFNITSVVRNSTGDYTITFTTAFANTNYVLSGFAQSSTTAGNMVYAQTGATMTVSVKQIHVVNYNNTLVDPDICTLMFIGA